MTQRTSALFAILGSPIRILALVLLLMFAAEVGVMLLLPWLVPPFLSEPSKAILDAILLTLICAPALWWVIIGPLRKIAIQEHERSETIVANAGEGILTLERDGTIVSCNRAGAMLLEGAVADWIGKSIQSVIPGFVLQLENVPNEGRWEARLPLGRQFPIQVSVSRFPSESQELYIAILRDLTDTERSEQQRIAMVRETEGLRAQQMTTLAQLATGVAHEVRNPLTSIKMLIQVNRAKFAAEGLSTDDLDLVEQEIRRMERSVNSLLEYARPEKCELSTLPIQEVIARSLRLVEGRCKAQNVIVQRIVPTSPIPIYVDAAQIQQLLLNLLLNALDVLPEGGEIQLTVERKGNSVLLKVADSGAGIDERIMERLFTPFATTKPNGVGLGLGICRRIAESHQGTLTGTNRAEGGAEFCLILPCRGGEADNHSVPLFHDSNNLQPAIRE